MIDIWLGSVASIPPPRPCSVCAQAKVRRWRGGRFAEGATEIANRRGEIRARRGQGVPRQREARRRCADAAVSVSFWDMQRGLSSAEAAAPMVGSLVARKKYIEYRVKSLVSRRGEIRHKQRGIERSQAGLGGSVFHAAARGPGAAGAGRLPRGRGATSAGFWAGGLPHTTATPHRSTTAPKIAPQTARARSRS